MTSLDDSEMIRLLAFKTTARNGAERLRHDENGSSVLEFAIIVPILVLIIVGSIDYALSILAAVQVEEAARAGAQYLAINGASTSGVTAAVTGAIPKPVGTISLGTITLDCATTNGGTYSKQGAWSSTTACSGVGGVPYGTVTASIAYRPLFPLYWTGLTGGVLNISGSATTRFQ